MMSSKLDSFLVIIQAKGSKRCVFFFSKEGKLNYISEKVCMKVGEVLSGYICV